MKIKLCRQKNNSRLLSKSLQNVSCLQSSERHLELTLIFSKREGEREPVSATQTIIEESLEQTQISAHFSNF